MEAGERQITHTAHENTAYHSYIHTQMLSHMHKNCSCKNAHINSHTTQHTHTHTHLKRVMLVLVDGSSIGNYLQREVIAVIQGWFGS